jgi:AraC family transcriptional regulator
MTLQHAHGGLSREKLIRAIEYIQEQMTTDLTVAAIAQSVNMSPDHFARLFKQSTGRSPYRYVIEARARKGRDLLASGKFSIVEIAHNLGFADQNHLTRQVKEVFGITPKMLLEKDI